jgi:hypothetical protein
VAGAALVGLGGAAIDGNVFSAVFARRRFASDCCRLRASRSKDRPSNVFTLRDGQIVRIDGWR